MARSPPELSVECQVSHRESNTAHSCVPQWLHAANITSFGGFGHSALTAINTGVIYTNVQKEGLSAGFLYLFPHHKTVKQIDWVMSCNANSQLDKSIKSQSSPSPAQSPRLEANTI
jgi:hypothetical protein